MGSFSRFVAVAPNRWRGVRLVFVDVFGAGGTYGAVIVKLVVELCECPLSSETLHVMPTAPVGAPAEEYSAVVPLPVTVPAVAE